MLRRHFSRAIAELNNNLYFCGLQFLPKRQRFFADCSPTDLEIIYLTLKMMKKEQDNNIQIELSEDIALGIYSNMAVISHSTSEFILDFIRLLPGVPKAKVMSRVVLTPEHAKRLLLALNENVKKYESQHGAIKLPDTQGGLPTLIGPMGEA
jgi:hypothetical protein